MSSNRTRSLLHDPRTFALFKGAAITIGMVIVAIFLGIGMDNFLQTRPLMITLLLIVCIPSSMGVTLAIAKETEAKMKADRQKQLNEQKNW